MVLGVKHLFILSLLFLFCSDLWAIEKLPLGQLLFIGIEGTELNSHVKALLEDIQPGGIILFKRNIISAEQTLAFNNDMIHLFAKTKDNSPVLANLPLLAIDQEGGGVYRVPTEPLLPSAAALGRTKSKTLLRNYGKTIGRILRELKFTMNLAPVLDLRTKESDFIGTRSFGNNPQEVSNKGILFAKGLLEEGVMPTGKHFPGVGGLNLDPHTETPLGDLDWVSSWDKDLLPFREFSSLYPSALLLSHVIYPKMDSNKRPASFSKNIIEKGLREKIKFRGLVITDDLMMEGAKKQASPSKSAIESLKAGADMIMVTWSESLQKKLVKDIEQAIRDGTLNYDAVKQKIARISKVKNTLMNNNYLNINTAGISFKSQELETLNAELLQEILAQDNINRVELKKNIAAIPLFIVDSPIKIQKDILLNRKPKLTEFFSIKKTTDWEIIRKRMQKNKQMMVLFFIKNIKAIKNLDWFSEAEKKQMIIVNIQTVDIKDKEKYAHVFSPFWTFSNLYPALAEVLNKKIGRELSHISN